MLIIELIELIEILWSTLPYNYRNIYHEMSHLKYCIIDFNFNKN